MTPVTATQDEDLLIISEDTADTPADMNFSFSFGEDAPTSSTQNSAATESIVDPTVETTANLGDFSLDIFQENVEAPQAQSETPLTAETVSQTPAVTPVVDFGFADIQPTTQETTSVEAETFSTPVEQTQSVEGVTPVITAEVTPGETISLSSPVETGSISQEEGLNDILTATITKLAQRAQVIQEESSGKSSQITDIQAQIKALEEQVASLEGDISLLTAESEKITKNIEALEEMKLDPVKEHNARRVAKK